MGTYGKVSGAEDAKEVDIDTAFMLASVAKTYTGATVAVLIDQNIIDLDDDICDVIGEVNTACRNPAYMDVPVTWRMLMTHRSSLNRDPPFLPDGTDATYGPTGVNYPGEIKGNPSCPIDDVEQFYEDLLVDKETETTVGQADGLSVNWYDVAQADMGGQWNETLSPGEKAVYSNVGVSYVAALLPKATQNTAMGRTSFPDFFQKYVADKVGMAHTAWFRRDLSNGTMTAMPVYPLDNQTGTWEDIGHYCWANYADGQLYSSIRDVAAFANVMTSYGIGTLWSNETAEENYIGCQERDGTNEPIETDCDFSLAWEYLGGKNKAFYGGNGTWATLDWTNSIGHQGSEAGVASSVVILPEEDSYVIVIFNTEGADIEYFTDQIIETGMSVLLGVDTEESAEEDDDGDTDAPTMEESLTDVPTATDDAVLDDDLLDNGENATRGGEIQIDGGGSESSREGAIDERSDSNSVTSSAIVSISGIEALLVLGVGVQALAAFGC